MDDQAHLEPGFDPTSLTVPRLRSILLAHSVNYPASAKKSQLVDLFNENVASQARKIKSASLRVKRSSKGIVDVPSSQSTTTESDEEETMLPPPSTRTVRSATRARTQEAEEIAPTPRATRHSTAPPERMTPRQSSSKHARITEDTIVEEPERKRAASRKSRQSVAAPVNRHETDDGGAFSSENVFQSGSSPPEPTDRRRTTHSTTEDAKRRRSREVRRRTDEPKPARRPQMDGAVVPTRRTFEVPVVQVQRDEIEASEEFTPEEQQELATARQAGELVPARRRVARGSKAAPNALAAIFVAILGGLVTLWTQEKFNVGYCGVGQPSTEVAGVEIPEWADIIRPACESCPAHAICNDKLQTTCEPGFLLTRHPLSLAGALPIPPSCEPDSQKARKVKSVKERAVEELREQNAKYECGDAASPEFKESELKKTMGNRRNKGMSNEEWEDLWSSAFGEVLNAEEVSTGADG